MKKEVFNFELKDTESPEEVIAECAKEIEECTNNMVICNVLAYDGKTTSYVKTNGLLEMTMAVNTGKKVDIQDFLGEQSNVDNKYEVFLSVQGLDYYKYLIMFLNYRAIAYPGQVVLNEDIAEAYNGKKQYVYDIASKDELRSMFETIINTEYFTELLQSLIYESMRQARKNKQE